MLSWIQGAAILRRRTSDINRLRHWHMHVWTSYVCPRVFYLMYPVHRDLPTLLTHITILHEASAKLCHFQQCTSDVNDLAYIKMAAP